MQCYFKFLSNESHRDVLELCIGPGKCKPDMERASGWRNHGPSPPRTRGVPPTCKNNEKVVKGSIQRPSLSFWLIMVVGSKCNDYSKMV